MKIDNLVSALEEQQDNMKAFVECAVTKQKAMVENELAVIEQILLEEEKIFVMMDEQGKKIAAVVGDLADEYSLQLQTNSVSEFMKAVRYRTDINVKVITLLQNSIRELVSKAIYTNEQNKILISHARSFLRETIVNLVALNNNQLLDRKV